MTWRFPYGGRDSSKHGKQVDLSRLCVAVCCSVLQCVAVCCSVLQCVAVSCSAWQCVAVCCSASQCVFVCCRVLQCVKSPKTRKTWVAHIQCVCVCVADVCVYVLQILIHTYGTKRGRPHMHLSTHEGNAQGLKRLENTQTNKNLVVMLVDFFCCLLDGLAWRRSFAQSCVANNDTHFNMYVCIRVYN